ncbi:tyrosine-protein phosphatase [Rubellimicrobium roseum]|uniref:Tyrosine specific protein phosphatases domain-containing protein n=1 Tax=Rubellimicrobium roseum TaxID=687525 RepID=A0A5C4NK83_9RHOB|nr:tyrosine-protein phosphatase [Rubellimicrobium roseum]TNC73077.1 hypothetical protein FHG71_07230 [Rubellimicrobium roseum]
MGRIERLLRGAPDAALVGVRRDAHAAPCAATLRQLPEVFRRLERPFLLHCKSGADRSGLARALCVLHEGAAVAQARRHLSLRYLHMCRASAGVLGRVLDHRSRWLEQGPSGIENWVRSGYDPEAAQAGFER